jgi:RNA polymerase sigma-70 factor (ECF subfamily)
MARRSVVDAGAAVPGRGREAHPSQASVIATEIKGLLARGERDQARERFGALVALLQRRALRVAFQYLRNPADADEAVQDAFIKVFLNLDRYREDLAFDTWFTRILVNASLDRLKARSRQQRFIATPGEGDDERMIEQVPAHDASTERRMLARERWQQVSQAVAALPDRQRLVFTLSQVDEQTPAEIASATGMSAATVRVHLFRALRKLRGILGEHA